MSIQSNRLILEQNYRDIIEIKSELKKKTLDEQKVWARIRQQIMAGETSGDVAWDIAFFLGNAYDFSVEAVQNFMDRLKNKVGELVALRFLVHRTTRFGGPGESETRSFTVTRIGCITSEQLSIADEVVKFPTDKFVQTDNLFCPTPSWDEGSDLFLAQHIGLTYNSRVPQLSDFIFLPQMQRGSRLDGVMGESLYIGDHAVQACLAELIPNHEEVMNEVRENIDLLVLRPEKQ